MTPDALTAALWRAVAQAARHLPQRETDRAVRAAEMVDYALHAAPLAQQVLKEDEE